MTTYTIGTGIYTVTRRGLNETRAGWRSHFIPFTSMLTVTHFLESNQIKITLTDDSIHYIAVEEGKEKEKELKHLVQLYNDLC